jgi:ribosome biogenesis GTPase
VEHPLAAYGWSDRVAALFAAAADDVPGAVPGRVIRADRGSVLVASPAGTVRADPYGTTSRQAGLDTVPVTGDWVAVAGSDGDEASVVAVLPRWSTISRKDPDERVTAEQVLAANVDVLAVVCALDRPVGGNRIERMLAAAWESGATPVVVLTKADLAADAGEAVREAEAAAGGVTVVLTSTASGEGVEEVRSLLGATGTLALLGPSGAGKSTLVNRLAGTDVLATSEVREGDARGRHTTTARHLVPVPGGGVLLDTPGVRSLPLWDAEAGVAATFDDVETIAGGCRFGDCRHDGEPGCAVREAVDAGTLDGRRFESWAKLRRELESLEARQDEQARRAAGRRMGRIIKQHYELKGPRDR